MSQNNNRAQEVYDKLCNCFDEKGWHYTKHEEDYVVTYSIAGDGLDKDFVLFVNYGERELIKVMSRMPVTIKEENRIEAAIAVTAVNYGLADGKFDYDIASGNIDFSVIYSYMNAEISDDFFEFLISLSSYMVGEYNHKFFAYAKGYMSLEDFLKDE